MDVFAHSLTYMKKHLLRAVSAHLGYDPHPDTVRWVLTVPAIWDENAKQFMREAAYKVSDRFRLSSPRRVGCHVSRFGQVTRTASSVCRLPGEPVQSAIYQGSQNSQFGLSSTR